MALFYHNRSELHFQKQKKRLVPASSKVDLDDAQVYTVSWLLLVDLWLVVD